VYPPQLKQAAKNLLDNQDFRVILTTRITEIREDIEQQMESNEILKSHAELNNIKDFAQWIERLGEGNLK